MRLQIPTEKQIINSGNMGWEYIGDGLFAKGEELGYFIEGRGWDTGNDDSIIYPPINLTLLIPGSVESMGDHFT